MRIVVALGGNALLKRGEPLTVQNQRKNVKIAARALAPLAREHSLVITHGNGPQVGLLALEAAAYTGVEPYTLDVLGAESEGMIGYMIEQELGNILPEDVPFATILTQVEVDPSDPIPPSRTPPNLSDLSTRGRRRSVSRASMAGRWGLTTAGTGDWSRHRSPRGSSSSEWWSCWWSTA